MCSWHGRGAGATRCGRPTTCRPRCWSMSMARPAGRGSPGSPTARRTRSPASRSRRCTRLGSRNWPRCAPRSCVDVDIEMVHLDAYCTTADAACPGCGVPVDLGSQLLPAVSLMSRVPDEASYSSCVAAGPAVPVREHQVPRPDVRGADIRSHLQARPAHRTTAFHPDRSRPRPGWSSWRPPGSRARHVHQPEYGSRLIAGTAHRSSPKAPLPGHPRRRRSPTAGTCDTTSGKPLSERFANRVRARHATVHALLEAGHSCRSIGRQLQMTHRIVKSLADAAKPGRPLSRQAAAQQDLRPRRVQACM